MDDGSKMNLPHLPAQEGFYSALAKTECSNDEYRHTQGAWKEFGCLVRLHIHIPSDGYYADGQNESISF